MLHRRTIRILVTLFTTVMVAVQAFSMGLAIRCDGVEAACASAREDSASPCCHSRTDTPCSKSGACCCGMTCACGNTKPAPATPHESDSGSKVQQLLASLSCHSAQDGVLRVVEQPLEFAAAQPPVTKAGVNTLLCVWLT